MKIILNIPTGVFIHYMYDTYGHQLAHKLHMCVAITIKPGITMYFCASTC